jgi:hypothetical protein
MSARENIAKNIEKQLQTMTNPQPGLVSRKFFDFTKIAITQFPAILVTTNNETREDIGMDLRRANLVVTLRCFVRGNELDTLKNEIIERIEEQLETQRGRDIDLSANNIHNVTTRISAIEVIEREIPLAEVVITVNVLYTYKKGVV